MYFSLGTFIHLVSFALERNSGKNIREVTYVVLNLITHTKRLQLNQIRKIYFTEY